MFCVLCGKDLTDLQTDYIKAGNQCLCTTCVETANMLSENLKQVKMAIEGDEKTLEHVKAECPSPKEIVAELDKYVVAQDDAKKVLSLAVYNHVLRVVHNTLSRRAGVKFTQLRKNNVMLLGPTGSGKSFLIEKIAEFINIPFVIIDATTITSAGYVGGDVSDMLEALLMKCNFDPHFPLKGINAAQKGIIYIDEIDKIATCRSRNDKDPSGTAAQHAYLKMVEGSDVQVTMGSSGNKQTFLMNTSEILFICGGAFTALTDVVDARKSGKSTIGFGSNLIASDRAKTVDGVLPEDLIKFGMIPEFVGRFPIITVLKELTDEDLLKILRETDDSPLKEMTKLFQLNGIELVLSNDIQQKIVKRAKENGTGARGLRALLSEYLTAPMFDCFGESYCERVTIDKEGKARIKSRKV